MSFSGNVVNVFLSTIMAILWPMKVNLWVIKDHLNVPSVFLIFWYRLSNFLDASCNQKDVVEINSTKNWHFIWHKIT